MRLNKVAWFAAFVLTVWFVDRACGQTIRERIRERRAARRGAISRPTEIAGANGATTCGGRPNVGFRILRFSSGLRAAVWYPVLDAERSFGYANGLTSGVSENSPVATCGKYPVIVFSHGFGGCSTQSLFVTEELARNGYVVVAPDHKDAGCKVDEPRRGFLFERAEEPFRRPEKWSERTFIDRRNDIRAVLDELPEMPEFAGRVDMDRVAGMGHSLGGYTVMAMAGAWRSWKDPRIKAVLLFSPYAAPFLSHSTVRGIEVPVMYQGGQRDRGITPYVKKAGGVYDLSNAPKYFVEFRNQGHLDWTVRACRNAGSVASCISANPNVRAINENAIAFLQTYVPGGVAGANRPAVDLKSGPVDRTVVSDYRAKQ